MSNEFDAFIQLDRTFHEVPTKTTGELDTASRRRVLPEKLTQWPQLLEERRVILLSEAGSGKTSEIRHVCRQLRSDGKSAFFLRIESMAQDFEDSFEEGTFEQFESWRSSKEEAWLFLDSVDEARLRSPKDFELAIRKAGHNLRSVLQRAHIIITSRGEAWRPVTDLALCNRYLDWIVPQESATEVGQDGSCETSRSNAPDERRSPYRIFALDDLSEEKVRRFAEAKGISDVDAFIKALERTEAWSYTSRPLDLAETVEFWLEKGSIGSRLELMRASIDRRLVEYDQDRAETGSIPAERLRRGVCLVAAASTLAKESEIRVPDGQNNKRGLEIRQVLKDWHENECRTLLTKAIFDEGIYGTVRFHHRTVREFLTAEWFSSFLKENASRARIENLFFRKQYGIDVVVPSMRPVLPWLAIFDHQILDRILRIAPEVLFEGGDPSQLPRETRARILRETCRKRAQSIFRDDGIDFSGVQRFTNPDLAEVIRELLDQYSSNDDVVCLLMRMVYQGNIDALRDKAKFFALSSRHQSARWAAIRAVMEVGTRRDRDEVRRAFISEKRPLNRNWLAALLDGSSDSSEEIEWIIEALSKAQARKRFDSDRLSNALSKYVDKASPSSLLQFLEGLEKPLSHAPQVTVLERKISKEYGWLTEASAQILTKMIECRERGALEPTSLSILSKLYAVKHSGLGDFSDIPAELFKLVVEWADLNRALFWHCVSEERIVLQEKGGSALNDYTQIVASGECWKFTISDFDWVIEQIADQPFVDDKLIALTLAVQLYYQNDEIASWLTKLNDAVAAFPALKSVLDGNLAQAERNRAAYEKHIASWQQRAEEDTLESAEAEAKAKRDIAGRLDSVRCYEPLGKVSSDQYYLHQHIRAHDKRNDHWTDGEWRSLIGEFGEDIAKAYRDGAVGFWRHYKPQLCSEGSAANSVPFEYIFGLTGLAIEARETTDWPAALTRAEAEIATRYALREMNGFPSWLPQLYARFPTEVLQILIKEVEYELSMETKDNHIDGVLSDISHFGEWIWDGVASYVIDYLRSKRINYKNLDYLLSILNRSNVEDSTINALAAKNSKSIQSCDFASRWFATWVGVDPVRAIPALEARLASLKTAAKQTDFAIAFARSLLGSRGGTARQAYRSVAWSI